MSNQEMADRIYNILKMKEKLGMGYGTHQGALKGWKTRRAHMRGLGEGEGEGDGHIMDYEEMMGHGGARKKIRKAKARDGRKAAAKHNPWLEFLAEARAEARANGEVFDIHKASQQYARMHHAAGGARRRKYKKQKRAGAAAKHIEHCPRGKKMVHVPAYTKANHELVDAYNKCVAAGLI